MPPAVKGGGTADIAFQVNNATAGRRRYIQRRDAVATLRDAAVTSNDETPPLLADAVVTYGSTLSNTRT